MTYRKAHIAGVGAYLPEEIVSNDDLSRILDTSDEWIRTRSGIAQRHRAAKGQTTSDLAVEAARDALRSAGIKAHELDMIIVATTTPDQTFPATAALVQQKLGISQGAAFDVQAVCSGFVYGLSVAAAMVETGQAERVLLIGAECMTRLLDWQDRSTAVLFGDGAGAVVVQATDTDSPHIIDSYLRSDGMLSDLLYVDGGVSSTRTVGHLRMQGREVYRHAVGKIAEAIETLLARQNLTIDDIDWFVPHQANARIIFGVADRIGLPRDKTVVTVHQHANTSAASIPLALHAQASAGKIKPGQLIMLEAMGGGLTWGANLLRWS